jgi:zinc D-Ala-D-Ala carboxypeptidase
MNLSPNFTLAELTASETAARNGLDNTPGPIAYQNLVRLANFLEEVKKVLGGKPIMINSAYRGPEVNAHVGGSKNSQHMVGCAADIKVPGMTPDQICKAIIASELQYDQLIREFDSWTHISIPNEESSTPRGQTLIIDRAGTRPFV